MTQPEKKPPQGSSSRTVVIVAVAVLIVVAIAGIVLAGMRPPVETPVAGLPATPSDSDTTSAAASAPTDGIPKDVRFAAGSDKLPAGASEGIARFADAVRAGASSVRLSTRFLTGQNKERDMELAKARAGAIRHALEADGISAGKIRIELTELPAGSVSDEAGNRVDLGLQ